MALQPRPSATANRLLRVRRSNHTPVRRDQCERQRCGIGGARQRAGRRRADRPPSVPALRHANRCGGRLSAKGTTRLQPNGIPRRQWVRPGGHSRTGHLLLTPAAASVFPARRRTAVIRERRDGLAWSNVRVLVVRPLPGAAGGGQLAVSAGPARPVVVAGSAIGDAVVAGAVVAGSLVAGAVVAGSLVAGAVVAGSLVAGTVVAGSLVAGTVVAGMARAAVAAGSLVARAVIATAVVACRVAAVPLVVCVTGVSLLKVGLTSLGV